MTNKDIALSYLRKGLSVIPLWSRAQIVRNPPSYFTAELNKKHEENKNSENPISDDQIYQDLVTLQCKKAIPSWKEFQKRLPTVKEVSDWFDKWPDANIGIVTGKVSNLVVFDLDSEGAVEYAESEGGFPMTAKVKTGKGYHVYAQYPDFEVRNDVRKELDIDIRADGGYAVAPPSIHGNGNQYEWEEGLSIFDIDPAPCEYWMKEYLRDVASSSTQSKQTKEMVPKTPQSNHTAISEKVDGEYASILQNGAQTGNRNHTTARLVGHLLAKSIPTSETWEMVCNWNAAKNSPPLGQDELRKTFDSVSKLESKNKRQKKDEKPKEEIKVETFLDTPEKVVSAYSDDYVRIPFDADGTLKILEQKMNGGLAGGCLYILGGIPSAGKTGLINNTADNLCLQGYPVLFFSYDDGRSELRYRTYARFSGFEIEEFNKNMPSKSDIEAIADNDIIKTISPLKYVVQQSINTEDWPGLIEQVKKRHDKAPVIIIDYLRKLRTKDHQADERLRVDEILSYLTEMAKAHNTPVLVISELARDSYKSGQRLSMASFKESGSIEYEASWLGILAAVEETDAGYSVKQDWEKIVQQDGNVDLIVFKAKRGTGETGKIALKMYKNKMTFRDRIEGRTRDSITQLKSSKYS